MCSPAIVPLLIGAGTAAAGRVVANKLSRPKSPNINVTAPEQPTTAETVDDGAARARALMRRRAAALGGRGSTMITGPQGATATGQMKTLLGS